MWNNVFYCEYIYSLCDSLWIYPILGNQRLLRKKWILKQLFRRTFFVEMCCLISGWSFQFFWYWFQAYQYVAVSWFPVMVFEVMLYGLQMVFWWVFLFCFLFFRVSFLSWCFFSYLCFYWCCSGKWYHMLGIHFYHYIIRKDSFFRQDNIRGLLI